MKKPVDFRLCSIPVLIMILLVGCKPTYNPYNSPVRSAENSPKEFMPPRGINLDDISCKSPMVDPNDESEIVMISALNGEGLYVVSAGKYGVNKDEALKLDCSSGEVMGIVKIR